MSLTPARTRPSRARARARRARRAWAAGAARCAGSSGATPVSGDAATSPSASSTVRTTPHGTPTRSSSATHSAARLVATRARIAATTSARCARRPAFVAKRASSSSRELRARAPWPRTARRFRRRSPARGRSPRTARRERGSRARFPSAPPSRPVTSEFCATLISAAVALCCSETISRRSAGVPAARTGERGENRDRRVLPGENIDERDAGFHRRAVRALP